jgi:hypothetical protein
MDSLVCVAALLIFSFIEMWCAIAYCVQRDNYSKDCDGHFAFAVALGLVSCLLCAAVICLMKFKPEMLEGVVGMVVSAFSFAWWFAGVAVCTFDDPFNPDATATERLGTYTHNANIAGNGYFATWLSVIFSALYMGNSIPQMKDMADKAAGAFDQNGKFCFMVLFASVVELWAAAKACDDTDCDDMTKWGVAAGAGSTLIALVWLLILKFVTSLAQHTKFVGLALTVWWCAAVVTLTMPNGEKTCDANAKCGLFLQVGNGFLGTWVALVASLLLTASGFGVMDEPAEDGASHSHSHSHHSHTTSTTTTTTVTTNAAKQPAPIEGGEQPTAAPKKDPATTETTPGITQDNETRN